MEYSVQKTVESSLFRGLTPTFHVIFHIICFFTTNGDTTNCKSLENSQGNFHDGVSLIKVKPTVFRLQLYCNENSLQIRFGKRTIN